MNHKEFNTNENNQIAVHDFAISKFRRRTVKLAKAICCLIAWLSFQANPYTAGPAFAASRSDAWRTNSAITASDQLALREVVADEALAAKAMSGSQVVALQTRTDHHTPWALLTASTATLALMGYNLATQGKHGWSWQVLIGLTMVIGMTLKVAGFFIGGMTEGDSTPSDWDED